MATPLTAREVITETLRGRNTTLPAVAIYDRMLLRGSYEVQARQQGLGILKPVTAVSPIAPPFFLVPTPILPSTLTESANCRFSLSYEWHDHTLLEIHTYETPVGTISQHVHFDTFGSRHRERYYINSLDDYRVLQYIVEHTCLHTFGNACKDACTHLGEAGIVLTRLDRSPYQKVLLEFVRPDRFLLDLYDHPETLEELFQVIEAKLLQQLALSLECASEFIWLPDNVTADFAPPYHYEKYLLPYYCKVGDRVRRAGKLLVVHMDGKAGAIKDLIARSPIDVIESFSHPIIGGDLPLPEALSAWTGKAITPNFPASLSTVRDEVVVRFLDELTADFAGYPLLLQLSEDIPWHAYPRLVPVLMDYFSRLR